MSAPIGNQFWKQRSKHGRDVIFSDPDKFWESCCEYFEWCDNNPLKSYEYNGKDAIKCDLEFMRAYTWQGLALFLDVHVETVKELQNKKDFSVIYTRVASTIFNQKFTGAAAGLLKENIISRELGLADKLDNKVSGEGIKILLGQNRGEATEGLQTTVND